MLIAIVSRAWYAISGRRHYKGPAIHEHQDKVQRQEDEEKRSNP